MTIATDEDVADRLALRGLIDASARCADRRLPEPQADLSVDGGRPPVDQGPDREPVQVLGTRDEPLPGVRTLARSAATTHVTGRSALALAGDRATGERCCLAHHSLAHEQGRRLVVPAIRDEDAFAEQGGGWRFARRSLVIDWTDTRPLQP